MVLCLPSILEKKLNQSESNPNTSISTSGTVDWFIFSVGSLLLLSLVILITGFPEPSAALIDRFYLFISTNVGVLYVLGAISLLSFLLWLAFGRYGSVVFGDMQKPVYPFFSWCSMLFCSGIGASLIYWGATEWVFYYIEPPFGAEARSTEAIRWSTAYGLFHWGPIGWAFYCLPAIALGCSYHIKKLPALRLSAACEPVLKLQKDRWPGRVIDLFFLIGVVASSATGLGFGTSVVSSSISELTGLRESIQLQIMIIIFATGIIAYSVYRGLEKGILILSKINMSLAILFIIFVFVVGPSKFILEMGIASIGVFVSEFFRMLTWTDPMERANFVESWTIFYWAWWLAMGPFMGMFICRISEGRTIRQVILGVLGCGSLGCFLFFIVLGNYALYLELAGTYDVVEHTVQASPSAAIAGIVALLPMGQFWLIFLAVIGLIFMSTTYDSASYTLAAGATRELKDHQHPARWHRVFWAIALGALPLSLLAIGGLRELQTASLVASLPILFIYILLAISIMRTLKNETKKG
ncbi:MAG: BCCT family transporter [Gammaproteobacteria bacterium]|nr:BCCT family transporter [Gammaproteobacteria bacterium]